MNAMPFLRAFLFLPVVFIMTVFAAKTVDYSSFNDLRSAVTSMRGWVEQESRYLTYTKKELYYIIGKAAKEFDKNKLKKGVSVLSSSSIQCYAFVLRRGPRRLRCLLGKGRLLH